ncbi:hypothetical protein [Winogradskyella tangerina]|uniref:hypothetical protein n=1 Tax=Winogradskyella tangerina TaxID=2023240 RepID=UPI000DBE40C0|nr:hypothetical protein [Winogradskyella tangerina]
MAKDLEYFKQQYQIIKDMCDADSGFEELEELEGEVEMEIRYIDDTRLQPIKDLMKLRDDIRNFIADNTNKEDSHNNPEAELDRLIPGLHDEDFDEEDFSSWDNLIGDD